MTPAATSDESEYVPVNDWPTLEEMADGFREHLMPVLKKLQGKPIIHTFDNGMTISHEFAAESLRWKILEGEGQGQTGQAKYEAFEVRPDIFFIDFLKPDYNEVVTMVADLTNGQAITGLSGFRDQGGERRTFTNFMNATSYENKTIKAFESTEELIGKHVIYRYSSKDAYEHIYLNKGTLVWHCLSGSEKGIADVEQCKMLKLRDNLYLLFWTETVMPVESVVVIDLEKKISTGRFYCWDPKPKAAVHLRFGSYATVVSETSSLETLKQVLQKKA
ncbi:molybdenum cofactor biosynthesis protein F [Fusarium tricinctum]|uniref:Molybdenum cofactor biosynthesis protein F n=1 Tax=Fusarium tricinctum TaxID=61284 RepID=A0A8K0RJF4_9HYPO|nr:molybdenum cofactor biosynthesis protein F [Fusarium tricinctum]